MINSLPDCVKETMIDMMHKSGLSPLLEGILVLNSSSPEQIQKNPNKYEQLIAIYDGLNLAQSSVDAAKLKYKNATGQEYKKPLLSI